MTRFLFVTAGAFLFVSSGRADEAAQKRFESMERQIVEAKSLRIAFDSDTADTKGRMKIKGNVILAPENHLLVQFEGESGNKPSKTTFASDGKSLTLETVLSGILTGTSRAAPENLNSYLRGAIGRLTVMSGLNNAVAPMPNDPFRQKPANFKSLGNEKVGEIDAIAIGYSIKLIPSGNLASCKVWVDPKTNLPVKRTFEATRDGKVILNISESFSTWELNPDLQRQSFTIPK